MRSARWAASLLGLLLAQPALAQSFLIDGVIHDSQTLQPLSDVVVFLVDDGSGALLSPGELDPPAQQGQITGADGRYRFVVRAQHSVRLQLERPDLRFVFPSVRHPPANAESAGRLGGVACTEVLCGAAGISPSLSPDPASPYALRFLTRAGGNAANNHLPIDALADLVELKLSLDRTRARIGELVGVTAEIVSHAPDPVADGELSLVLPRALRPLQGSLRVYGFDGESKARIEASSRTSELELRAGPLPLALDRRVRVRLLARVAERAPGQAVQLLSRLERPGGIPASNQATANLRLEGDPLLDESTVLGAVFCDGAGPRPGWQDDEEEGLFGVRVYADTGAYADSDLDGRLHFSRLEAGTHLLKLDTASLPAKARLLSPERVQLLLTPGLPASVRFAVACAVPEPVLPTKIVWAEGEVPAEAAEPRTVRLQVDAELRRFELAETADGFLAPVVEAQASAGGLSAFPRLESSLTPTRWTISARLPGAEGGAPVVLAGAEGKGLPPPVVELRFAAPAEPRYAQVVLEVESGEYDRARSAPAWVWLGPTPEAVTAGRRLGTLAAELPAREVRALAAAALEALRNGERLRLDAFWSSEAEPGLAERESQALLERAAAALERAGLPRPTASEARSEPEASGASVELRARGDADPVAPNLSPRNKRQNRRVELSVVVPAAAALPAPPAERRPPRMLISVDKKEAEVPLDAQGRLDLTLDVDVPAQVSLHLLAADGGEVWASRVVSAEWSGRPGARAPVEPRLDLARGTLQVGAEALRLPAGQVDIVGLERGPPLVVRTRATTLVHGFVLVVRDPAGRVLAREAREGSVPPRLELALSSTATLEVELLAAVDEARVRSRRRLLAAEASQDFEPEALGAGVGLHGRPLAQGPVELSGRMLELGAGRLLWPLPELSSLPAAVETASAAAADDDEEPPPAADLDVVLPANGALLTRSELAIFGRTRPENKLAINGEPVLVAPDGRFGQVVAVGRAGTLVLESTDEEGNRVRYERLVRTSSSSVFVMAVGDATLGPSGAPLAGSTRHTHVDLGGAGFDGRVVAFADVQLQLRGPVSRLRLVGRLDSGAVDLAPVDRPLDDPLYGLSVTGDASREVRQVPEAEKLHLDVFADDSRLTVGGGATEVSSFGADSLFAYRRAGYGVHADISRSFGEHDHTQLSGVLTFGQGGQRRAHDEILGTNGTMLWLSHKELVPGSESVRVVARDRDTGMVLMSEEKVRGLDYEVRPREGRIVLKEPLPSLGGAGGLNLDRAAPALGQPLFLVVDYEYLADAADERGYALELRETLYQKLEVYGGVAGESGAGADWHLFGGALAYRPGARSYFELEVAGSSGQTGFGAVSTDGGLRYAALRPAADAGLLQPSRSFPGALDAIAVALTAQVDLGEVMGVEEDRGYARAYLSKGGAAFSAPSAARDAGRIAGGARGRVRLSDRLFLRASLDSAMVLSPIPSATPDQPSASGVRTLVITGLDYRDTAQGMTVEAGHLVAAGAGDDADIATGLRARYERRLSQPLVVSLAQEAIFGDQALTGSGARRFTSTLGASYVVSDALALSLTEMLRWNGDNATQVGLRVTSEDGFSAYIAERMLPRAGGPGLVTIIGAEDVVGEGGRTYGEYQLEGGASPEQARMVLGMDNRWRVVPGLSLTLGYERTQLLSDPSGSVTLPIGDRGGLSTTLGALDFERLAQGRVSRDALALGVEWAALEKLRLGARFEMRLDGGADAAHPLLSLVVHQTLGFQPVRELSLLERLTVQQVEDRQIEETYAKALEWSVGAAFRPRAQDWLTVLLRYTKQVVQRPREENSDGLRLEETRDAFSLEPIIDTPYGVQLVEKLALISSRARQDGAGIESGVDALWVNRLNARAFEVIEGGVEFRWLEDLALNTRERGFLVELGWVPDERVRVGVGYNFTRFSDDILVAAARDARGPFLRVTARY